MKENNSVGRRISYEEDEFSLILWCAFGSLTGEAEQGLMAMEGTWSTL